MTGIGAVGHLTLPEEGLRCFDPSRDLRSVIALLQAGFGADLDERDRRWLEDLDRLSSAGPLLGWALRMTPAAENVFGGYVWVEGGQVVGNASLMRATPRVWTIANVVVLPSHRRRGIARRLVQATVESARGHGAREVQLQVRHDNDGAQALYRQLGFRRLYSTTTWRRPADQAPRRGGAGNPAPPGELRLEAWPRNARWWIEGLLSRSGEIEGAPPGPVRQALAHQGARGAVADWLRGLRRLRLAARSDAGYAAVAAASAYAATGPHALEIVVDPRWRGRVESALLARLLAGLADHAPLAVDADVREDETGVTGAVAAAGFEPLRVLERMSRSL
jgi:ribosomal protein S18 acetylase RimI-like enzyme